MAVQLNTRAFSHAKAQVKDGHVVRDDRDAWSEHHPSTQEENDFIDTYGFEEYGTWHLGFDDVPPTDTKPRYTFPYGGFANVHRCAVISAERRAGQYKYFDIEEAAAQLHGMIHGEHRAPVRQRRRATRA